MATLDKLFPLPTAERPLRFPSSEAGPAELLREELRRMAQKHRGTTDELLAAIGICCFQLERARREQAAAEADALPLMLDALEILEANLRDVFERHGGRIEDLTGQPFTPADRERIDLRGHSINPELHEPQVAYMESPVVYRGDRLIARGAALIEAPQRD